MSSGSSGAIPQRIGHYLIREKIGSGGMATVYRAYNPEDGQDVAIKVLSIHMVDHATLIKRFEREGQTLLSISHPNILPVYDLSHEGVSPYIVMKLLDGRTLEHLLQGVPLPPEQAANITRQIASALDYAHARQVIHRDIKPSNILLDARSKPYLADFGIAYAPDTASRLTATGDFIGTAAYASPEQCRGDQVEGPSDIYSLGVVVYEMLTGKNPFVAPSSLAMMKKHMAENPPNPLSLNPRLPIEVYAVLLMALAKLPEHRFQSAIKFSEALDTALHIHRIDIAQDDDDMAWLVDRRPPAATVRTPDPTPHASAARTIPSGTEQPTPLPDANFTDLEFDDLTYENAPKVAAQTGFYAGDDLGFVLPHDLEDEFVIPEVDTQDDPFAEPAPAAPLPAAEAVTPPRRPSAIRPISPPPRPVSAPPRPAAKTAKPGWSRAAILSAAAVIVLIAAAVLLVILLRNKSGDTGGKLDKTYADAALGVRFSYPSGWDVDTNDAPVLPTRSPYTLTLADRAKIAIQIERIDPVAVYGIPTACQQTIVQGPEATFGCMAANETITPAYERFNNRLFDGVSLRGTLPPTNAMWPMVLLNLDDGDWLAVIITRWSDYKDAYDLLEEIARSVKPIE